MKRTFRAAFTASLPLAVTGVVAHADPPVCEDGRSGYFWIARNVRAPVATDAIEPVAPFVPASVPEVAGEVELDAGRAAAFYLAPLEVTRVRVLRGASDAVHFGRVSARDRATGGAGRVTVEEPAIRVGENEWFLSQPAGEASAWYVRATSRARVRIERIEPLEPRLAWDSAREAVIDWIARGGCLPNLPNREGLAQLLVRIRSEGELAERLRARRPGDERFARALRDWRTGSALLGLERMSPFLDEYALVESIDRDVAGIGGIVRWRDEEIPPHAHDFRRIAEPTRTVRLDVGGPGVLRIEARAILPSGSAEGVPITLATLRDGVLIDTTTAVSAAGSTRSNSAFPPTEFLRTDDGHTIGDRVASSITLAQGRHHYEIRFDGGPMAVRVLRGRHRPWLREVLAGHGDAEGWLRDARREIDGNSSPEAETLRAMLSAIDDGAAPRALPNGLPASLRVAALLTLTRDGTSPDAGTVLRRDAIEAMAAIERDTPALLRWSLRISLARALTRAGQAHEAAALFSHVSDLPPDDLLFDLASALPPPVLHARLRSRAVALANLGLRASLGDPESRTRAMRLFYSLTSWRSFSPVITTPEEATLAVGLFDRVPGEATAPSNDGALYRVRGRRRLTALPSPFGETRPAVMRAFIRTPAENPGPVHVEIDSQQWTGVTLDDIETWSFAVRPGDRNVQFEAPEGSDVFVNLAPADLAQHPTERAYVRRAWPVGTTDEPTVFEIPAPSLSGPIRVDLRTLERAGHAPMRVRVRTPRGVLREIGFTPGGASTAQPLDGAPPLTDASSFVVDLPAGTERVWFDHDDDRPLYVTVSLRAPLDDPQQRVGPSLDDETGGDPLEAIGRLTRILAEHPNDVWARLRRARRLLDLGEMRRSRVDILRALPIAASHRGALQAVDALLRALEGAYDPDHLAPDSLVGNVSDAVALAPARLDAGTVPDDAIATARRVRAHGAGDHAAPGERGGGERGVASRSLDAEVALRERRPFEAARAWFEVYRSNGRWQAGYEGLRIFETHLTSSDPLPDGFASIAFAIASELEGHGHDPLVRRALAHATRLSHWQLLHGAESSGGYEQLVERGGAAANPQSALERSLVAAPWPAEQAQLIGPSDHAVLDVVLDAPTRIRAEAWLEPWDVSVAGVTASVRADDAAATRIALAPLRRTVALDRSFDAGHHVVSVDLPQDLGRARVSVRFATQRPIGDSSLAAEADGYRPMSLTRSFRTSVARRGAPTEFTVLGPAVVRIETRALADDLAPALALFDDREPTHTVTWDLPPTADESARGAGDRPVRLTTRVERLVPVLQPGAHHLRIEVPRGTALVRAWVREDLHAPVDPPDSPWWLSPDAAEIDPIPLRATPMRLASANVAPTASQAGTFSFAVGFERNQVPTTDAPTVQQFVATEAAFRREMLPSRWWLRGRTEMRVHDDGTPVVGAQLSTLVTRLPGELRIRANGQTYVQPDAQGTVWSANGLLYVNRVFYVRPDLLLIPALGFQGRYTNVTASQANQWRGTLDMDVYNGYAPAHPFTVEPNVTLLYWPLQDHVFFVDAGAVHNTEFISYDRVEGGARWQGLFDIGPTLVVGTVGYLLSWRFADRDRANAYARHSIDTSAEVELWTGRTGRAALGASNTVVGSAPFGVQDVFAIWFRYDLTNGRGLRDYASDEFIDAFADRLARRFWFDLPNGASP